MFVFSLKQIQCQLRDIIQEDGGFMGLYESFGGLIDNFEEQQK
jgi:hypothetical protein